jgi:phenylalanyl-tRNA synthetase beta chain
MLVPLSWLKEYVDISGVSVEELQKKMSAAGLSVERKHTVGEGIEQIVIGQIVSQEKHPDSDHLWLCKVNIGTSEVQIVTGAQNIYLQGKVPVVLAGQVLPDGTKIEVSKLRGLESQGMMCSEKELGLGDSHEGIMMLGEDATVGTRLVEYLGLPDVVFDTEITANRGDCLSMVGIAREVATLLGKELKLPNRKAMSGVADSSYSVKVKIDDPKKCNRFAAVVFDGFQLGSSPMWMQQRLLRAGMRPINNLVDISNYVMLEIGQPTHAYDATQVKEHSFVVRTAQVDEKLQTLDKKVFDLNTEMLVIADSEKSLGIAGIMGGQSSKITQDTHSLLLEIANFDPVNIRKTGMRLGIRSDAIVRYERGVDRELVPSAMERVNYLLSELSGAHQASSVVDEYPTPLGKTTVSLRSHLLTRYMGVELPLNNVERILNSLGFSTVSKTGDNIEWLLTVAVPSWRYGDVSIEEDLIEEVARIVGYDNLPATIPKGQIPYVNNNKRLSLKKRSLELLRGLGFQEVLTYSFNSKDQIVQSGYSIEQALEMVAPLSEEHRYMRLSLLPNLLWVVQKNLALGHDLSLFELSSVYTRKLYDLIPDEAVSLGLEPVHLAGLVYQKEYSFDTAFQQIVSSLKAVFDQMQINNVSFAQDKGKIQSYRNHVMYHPGRVSAIMLGDSVIGLYGEIHPALSEKLGLKQQVFMYELFYDALVEEARLVVAYEPYSIYPATTESISFILDEQQAVGPIVSELNSLDSRVVSVSVGKPYRGDQIEIGKKAMTFTFVFQSKTGVIKEQDAAELRKLITQLMKDKFSVEVR